MIVLNNIYDIIMVSDGGSRNKGGKRGAFENIINSTKSDIKTIKNVAVKDSTNNFCELAGFLDGMLRVVEIFENRIESLSVAMSTDSAFVLNGITEENRLPKWRANGFMSYSNKPIKHKELWSIIGELYYDIIPKLNTKFNIEFYWVKGHLTKKEISAIKDPLELKITNLNIDCDDGLTKVLDDENTQYLTEEEVIESINKRFNIIKKRCEIFE